MKLSIELDKIHGIHSSFDIRLIYKKSTYMRSRVHLCVILINL